MYTNISIKTTAIHSYETMVGDSAVPTIRHQRDVQSARVLAGIPAYNEAATIGSVVLAAQEYCDHVIVIDDGSTDATATIAGQAGATVLEQHTNEGKGATIRKIFTFAREHDTDRLVLLDGDWQHNPAEIPALLEPLEADDGDVVIGSRYLDGSNGETPLYRRVGQQVLDWGTYLSSGKQVTDSQSGYRAFNRTAIETIDVTEPGFGIETDVVRSVADNGLEIEEVPISVSYDVPTPNSANSVFHGVRVVDTFLRIVRDRHPLLFFGVPGFILTVVGLIYGAWTVSIYQSGGDFYIGKALFSAVLFLVGLLSVYSALIMNMLGKWIDT